MSWCVSLFVRESKQQDCEYPKELRRNKVLYDCQQQTTYWLVGLWDRFEAIANFFKKWELHFVDIRSLKDLAKRCKKVLDNHSLAKQLLPTKQGYDDYYFEQLEETRKLMNRLVYYFKKHPNNECVVEIG